MKTAPIVPARIEWRDGDSPPYAPDFGDIYHPQAGAREQAQRVFLAGNGLPARWQGRARFVIVETGFGLGHNFLTTVDAWRADAQRPRRLVFVSIDKHPPTGEALARVHGAGSPLVAAWPPLTPNLHTLDFEGGGVRLLLALGDVRALLPQLVARADAFFLDGFAPARNPAMWDRHLLKAIGRLAAPGATAATWSAAREVREGLGAAGFEVERAAGQNGKRHITTARYAPTFVPRRAPARVASGEAVQGVLVIGAGLAGAAVAHALHREGVQASVLDGAAQPAAGASGNAGGLFHGIVTPQDGVHARFNRAAALRAAQVYEPLVAGTAVPGALHGLLRLETAEPEIAAMASRLEQLGLPPGFVEACPAPHAAALSGLPLSTPAWRYRGGGWLDPRALVAHWLRGVPLGLGLRVAALRRAGDAWQALDESGSVLASASHVVLANAHDAPRLCGAAWPLAAVRGQVTRLRAPQPRPAVPVAGAGYAFTLANGDVLCGATSQPGDVDTTPRAGDDALNAAAYAALAGVPAASLEVVDHRVGWRCSTPDRLPVAGAVPAFDIAPGTRLDQPRLVPRAPGLFVCTALGSRGITWAPLLGELVAAWIVGAPLPLEADLVDAVDPARFVSKAARRDAA